MAHGIGIPPPLVGRPGASGELETQQPNCDSNSSTMVRVPGSSGDSGFHRESLGEDVHIKVEPGIEVSTEVGSPLTRDNEKYFLIVRVLEGTLTRRRSKRTI